MVEWHLVVTGEQETGTCNDAFVVFETDRLGSVGDDNINVSIHLLWQRAILDL